MGGRPQFPRKLRWPGAVGRSPRPRAPPRRRRARNRGRLRPCARLEERLGSGGGMDLQESRTRARERLDRRGVRALCDGSLRPMTPRRLELDYVAAPSAPRWIGVGVLILALAVAGHLVLRYRDAQNQLAALDAAQGLLNADRRPQRPASKERLEQEAKIIDAAVRQLTLPWAQLIEAVEAASTTDVVVLQLQPEAQQRTLRLTAEAKNGDAMLRYVRRLGENRVLSDVYPASHQVQVDDP